MGSVFLKGFLICVVTAKVSTVHLHQLTYLTIDERERNFCVLGIKKKILILLGWGETEILQFSSSWVVLLLVHRLH